MGSRKKAEEFLRTAHEFHLGDLPTEGRNPLTFELAKLANERLHEAFRILKEVDLAAITVVEKTAPQLTRLAQAIENCFAKGGRIFLYGCGATGRLSLSLEYLWRLQQAGTGKENQVVGFMSGGDLALVRSIENFEDHPEYGARQLREIGFSDGDLLISCTEGGETPSVIGATEEAARISSLKPYFLYCNPDHVLEEVVERSRRVIQNPAIEKICLFTGPMALSGSTRMQASTVLMLAVGMALLPDRKGADAAFLRERMGKMDPTFLVPFTEKESLTYQNGGFLLYETEHYGVTILTDTTERSPTFSLVGFENQTYPNMEPSLCFLSLPAAIDTRDAWRRLLLREPIPLEWEELHGVAGKDRLYGFDFSREMPAFRHKLLAGSPQKTFQINRDDQKMVFRLDGLEHSIDVEGMHPLHEHLLLKMLLNAHSTLVMGRIGRYESNIMTWVKPSNNKLVDRAIRYVEYLLLHHDIADFSYREICYQVFEEFENLGPGESVVLKTFTALSNKMPIKSDK